jgi:hypothetical protein
MMGLGFNALILTTQRKTDRELPIIRLTPRSG